MHTIFYLFIFYLACGVNILVNVCYLFFRISSQLQPDFSAALLTSSGQTEQLI